MAMAVGAVGLWLVLTLPYGEQLGAGWRHELLSSSLAAIAIFAGCLAQGRRWPQPSEVYAVAGVALALAVLAVPVDRLAGLLVLAVVMAAGGLYALMGELRRAGSRPLAATIAVMLGIATLASIAPVFALVAADGMLQPPI